ncbi:DUF4184 family protein [Adhaeribacter swui]|uniref:DUF4184 family protein n=1 Tax=Adhaeribacter swui TaxID=2086471 RepID=A0A7G7G5A3_9BACT|nr:DUF4184 family protein [Adhaeribacter swui]QNF32337.1 DUF4184 family protein [Adhaeribacter swui]
MPFTFSHPAIVLPLYYLPRKTRSMTGLVVGSMAPDFEKFFRMSIHDGFSHTWPAIFYFNLPLAILLSFAFHQVVRDPLIDNLPGFLKKRLVLYKGFNWLSYFKAHYLIVVFSILVGVLSHLTWDSFTHPGGRLALMLPFLSNWIEVFNHYMLLSTFSDRVSSILGLLVISGVIFTSPFREIPEGADNKRRNYWFIMGFMIVFVLSVRLLIGIESDNFLWDFIISIISATLFSLFVTSYVVR